MDVEFRKLIPTGISIRIKVGVTRVRIDNFENDGLRVLSSNGLGSAINTMMFLRRFYMRTLKNTMPVSSNESWLLILVGRLCYLKRKTQNAFWFSNFAIVRHVGLAGMTA